MAGKLVFKLTGGKTDKDEEYESLKDEFLKYKKACEGVKSHSGKLYEQTISYAKRYLSFAEETEKFFEQAGSGTREGQGFKHMGEEIMELAKQLASAVGEVTAGVEVLINQNEGLRKRIHGREDVAVDLGYAAKSKDKDSKHQQKYDEAKQKYEEVNSKLKAALTDGQPKFREHYRNLIAAQQTFYKGLDRAASRLAELEERYNSSSSSRSYESAPRAAPAPIEHPSQPPPLLPQNSIKISLIHGRKLKAADLNGKSDPYCKIHCGRRIEKSKRKDNTLNPDWHEDFILPIDPAKDHIAIHVYDHDSVGSDDSLGSVSVSPQDIQKLVRGARTVFDLKISGGKGELQIALTAMDFGLLPPAAPPVSAPPPQPTYVQPPPAHYVAPVAAPQPSPPAPAHSIKISLIHGRKLKAADLNGKSDPYCKIRCGHRVEKSKRKDNTLNPDWYEDFVFPIDPARDHISIQIYDHDSFGSDDPLGSVSVSPQDIQKLIRGARTVFDLKVDGGKGELQIGTISLTAMDFGLPPPAAPPVSAPPPQPAYAHPPAPYAAPVAAPHSPPPAGQPSLKVSLIHGRKLKAADLNGKSDPYCKLHCGRRTEKSKRKDNTLNPDWHEDFVFPLDPSRDHLTIQVYDHDSFGSDDSLGSVSVSPQDIQKLVRGVRTVMDLKIDGGKGELQIALTAQDFGVVPTAPAAQTAYPYPYPPQQYPYPPPPPQYGYGYDQYGQPYPQQSYYPPPQAEAPREVYPPPQPQPPPVEEPVAAPPPVLPPRPVYNHVTPAGLSEAEANDLRARFTAADRDGSGRLDLNEVESLVVSIMGNRMQEANCRRLAAMQFRNADKDGSGSIDVNEFLQLYVNVRALGGLAPLESSGPPPVTAPRPAYSRPSQAGSNSAGQPPPPLPARSSASGNPPLPPRSSGAGTAAPPPKTSPKPRGIPPPHGLTDADVSEAQAKFTAHDADGSGHLNLEETIALLTELMKGKLQEGNLRRLASMHFQSADKDRSGAIDFNEFLGLYAQMKASAPR